MFWPNTVNDLATGSNNLIRAQPGIQRTASPTWFRPPEASISRLLSCICVSKTALPLRPDGGVALQIDDRP
jgi:hypothetical protein